MSDDIIAKYLGEDKMGKALQDAYEKTEQVSIYFKSGKTGVLSLLPDLINRTIPIKWEVGLRVEEEFFELNTYPNYDTAKKYYDNLIQKYCKRFAIVKQD